MAKFVQARWMDHLDTKPELSSRAMNVAVHLTIFMDNNTGECWPSLAKLAARGRVSESTVKRGLQELDKAGVLEKRRRHNSSSVYRALIDGTPQSRPANGWAATGVPVNCSVESSGHESAGLPTWSAPEMKVESAVIDEDNFWTEW